jgi:hypothetical protein
MRTIPLILLLGAAIPLTARGDVLREQSRQAIDIAGISTVVVHNGRGRIEARPSPDGRLHVTALKIVRTGDDAAARRLARKTVVELGRDGDRYTVRVRYPAGPSFRINLWEGFSDLDRPRVEVRLAIETPAGVSVELNGASADLFGERLTAPLTLHSASGDVTLESCTGELRVSTASGEISVSGARWADLGTASGDVEIEDARGPLRISTTSGDVSVGEIADSLTVQTSSGDVQVAKAPGGSRIGTSSGRVVVRHAAGGVRIRTSSGDVSATLETPLRSADVSTTSGEIRIALDDAVGCRIEMRTSSGGLDLDVPCHGQSVSRRLVTAVVRQGGPPVALRSVSGGIRVTRGGT